LPLQTNKQTDSWPGLGCRFRLSLDGLLAVVRGRSIRRPVVCVLCCPESCRTIVASLRADRVRCSVGREKPAALETVRFLPRALLHVALSRCRA
jgi:hypothetical protein